MRLATFPKNTSFGSFLPPIDFVLFGPPLHLPFLYVCSYSQAATISRQVVKSIICYSNSCNTPEVCRLFHSESVQSINCTLVINNCFHLVAVTNLQLFVIVVILQRWTPWGRKDPAIWSSMFTWWNRSIVLQNIHLHTRYKGSHKKTVFLRSGCRDFFKIDWHILTYFIIV